MGKFKSFLIVLVAALVSVFGTPLALVHADDIHGSVGGSLQNFITPNTGYFWDIATVDLKGVSKNDLFDFVTDVGNDIYWYPGVVDAPRLSGDGRTGTVYQETINLGGGFQYTDNVTIEAFLENHYDVEVSTGGPVNSWGYLVIKNTPEGASLTLVGVVPQNPFLTADALQQALTFAYGNLASHYNTTGTVTYTGGTFASSSDNSFTLPFDLNNI
jgi:hypothetical protein